MPSLWMIADAADVVEAAGDVPRYAWLVIGAFLGLVSAGLPFYLQFKRLQSQIEQTEAETVTHRADAAMTITNAAKSLIEPLSERVGELEVRVEDLEEHIDILEALLRESGMTPPARPLHPSPRRA